MKLQIGEKLKLLRSQARITQGQLADELGVSCQSVSRWELGICYPDIELLPALANYFDITLDELVGMQELRSEEARVKLFTDAQTLERQGDWAGAAALLREASRINPNDDGLLAELALVLSKTEPDLPEAIALSEKVLARSANEKIRSTLRANLCFLYRAAGQPDKAVACGKTLPHIWECRELLLPDLVPEDQRDETVAHSLNIAQQVLHNVVAGRPIPFSLGYQPEETMDLWDLLNVLL